MKCNGFSSLEMPLHFHALPRIAVPNTSTPVSKQILCHPGTFRGTKNWDVRLMGSQPGQPTPLERVSLSANHEWGQSIFNLFRHTFWNLPPLSSSSTRRQSDTVWSMLDAKFTEISKSRPPFEVPLAYRETLLETLIGKSMDVLGITLYSVSRKKLDTQ